MTSHRNRNRPPAEDSRSRIRLLGLLVAICLSEGALGQNYVWTQWSATGPHTAQTGIAGAGMISMQVEPSSTGVSSWELRFDSVPFEPTYAPCVAANNQVQFQNYSFDLDLAGFDTSLGLIIGIGNFGHNAAHLPGYRLEAFNGAGGAIAPDVLTQIGSYDHTWLPSQWPFNDDVVMTVMGAFAVTTVSGLDDNNSDILLLRLPHDVNKIRVSTLNLTGGDTVNVVTGALTHDISGVVALEDWQPSPLGATVLVEVMQSGTLVESQVVALGSSGEFSVTSATTGQATVAIKSSHWLRRESPPLVLGSGRVEFSPTLTNGDCDGDNEIGIGDYAMLSAAYGSSPGEGNWTVLADLNGDDAVDIADYAILSANYGEVGD